MYHLPCHLNEKIQDRNPSKRVQAYTVKIKFRVLVPASAQKALQPESEIGFLACSSSILIDLQSRENFGERVEKLCISSTQVPDLPADWFSNKTAVEGIRGWYWFNHPKHHDQKQDGRPPHIGFGHVGPRRVEQEKMSSTLAGSERLPRPGSDAEVTKHKQGSSREEFEKDFLNKTCPAGLQLLWMSWCYVGLSLSVFRIDYYQMSFEEE
ncbi:hypothetical protein GG344DRAFT_69166 [Lentinula edodes]|nr:hypothetical protein GG344DRAFT_69166 [Lentinula edodes]